LDCALTSDLCRTVEADSLRAVKESLPYFLRKSALDRKLSAFELGRALYHLIQRRGFKSNRKEGKKSKDDELGKVKAGISELAAQMSSAGVRTLGEYFAGLNSHERRIRGRWTARSMYEQEFERIWQAQRPYWRDVLDDDFKSKVGWLLFFQRPIAAQEHLIGCCELEPEERRAPWAFLEAQRFRVLQKVNDLEVIEFGKINERSLTQEEKAAVFAKLENEGDQSFAELRKLLGLKKSTFNLERGGEKRLRGNRTNAFMRSIFGVFWDEMPEEEKHKAVTLWYRAESEEKLASRVHELWALDENSASKFAETRPEDGYCSLSLKALRRLLPEMEKGVSYGRIRPVLYPELRQEPKDLLPVVREAVPSLRNPAVERALTEVRKVVNAIVRQYGKPYEIRIEMARELRKSRKEREESTRQIRSRQREREEAKAKILKECGIQNPSRSDIEKALLFEECGGICPYTGRTIEFSSLFGDSQFDIEHIIPLSRCPDDSFLNKTLCYHHENRSVKGGRTPWEAYGTDDERWAQILERVKRFSNPAKLRRFELRSEEELREFTERQMNDTRYTTRLAVDLLSTLYGGRDIPRGDGTNRKVIHATTGMVTATLRRSWGVEAILREAVPSYNGESKGKPRTDHRHHAVDAIVIALTSQSMVQQMSVAAANAPSWQSARRSFQSVESPWPNFVDSLRPQIVNMVVSHRPEHKMSGEFHDETNYGRPRIEGKKSVVHIRKPVTSLKEKDIASIVDPVVRRAVEEKFAALSGDLSRCEAANEWPACPASNGRDIPIRKVRVRKVLNVSAIGKGNRKRFVMPSSNHHVEVFAKLDVHGKETRWESIVVSLMDAAERKHGAERIVAHSYQDAEDFVFKFSLMGGDIVQLHKDCSHAAGKCSPSLFRLRTIAANGQLSLIGITDARMKDDIKKAKEWWSPMSDALRKLDCRKVQLDLLGGIHAAND